MIIAIEWSERSLESYLRECSTAFKHAEDLLRLAHDCKSALDYLHGTGGFYGNISQAKIYMIDHQWKIGYSIDDFCINRNTNVLFQTEKLPKVMLIINGVVCWGWLINRKLIFMPWECRS